MTWNLPPPPKHYCLLGGGVILLACCSNLPFSQSYLMMMMIWKLRIIAPTALMEAIFGVHGPFRGILNLLIRPDYFLSEYLQTSLCTCLKKIGGVRSCLSGGIPLKPKRKVSSFQISERTKKGVWTELKICRSCDICLRDLYTRYFWNIGQVHCCKTGSVKVCNYRIIQQFLHTIEFMACLLE
jgi:hypothetical protein